MKTNPNNTFRKLGLVCLLISVFRLLIGKLRLSRQYKNETVKMEDGQEFTIFRNIHTHPVKGSEQSVTFIVRFKFAKLSYKGNKIASRIPMLLITGYPGFQIKMYAANKETGYWQGMYQWKTKEHLDDYLNSFIYKMMNKRAIKESLSSRTYENQLLIDFIDRHKVSSE